MSTTATPPKPSLPTLNNLGITSAPKGVQAPAIAAKWLQNFAEALESNKIINDGNDDLLSSLFIPDSFWRDTLAFTWDIRSLHGYKQLKDMLKACLPNVKAFPGGEQSTHNPSLWFSPSSRSLSLSARCGTPPIFLNSWHDST